MIEIASDREKEIGAPHITDSEEWESDADVRAACRNPLMREALRNAFGRDICKMARPRDFMIFSLGQKGGGAVLAVPPLFSITVPTWVPVIGGKKLEQKAIGERCFVTVREGKLFVEFGQ